MVRKETEMSTYVPFEEVLAEDLQDPEERAEWDRTQLARDVAAWLLLYRKRHGLTQTQLAEQLGWRQSVVARLESGEREPSIATLHHLVERLGARARIDIRPERVALHFLGRPRRVPRVLANDVRSKRSAVRRSSARVPQP